MLSHLCETFIFIYLGVTMYTYSGEVYKFVFIFTALVRVLENPTRLTSRAQLATVVARAANVFPISWMLNTFSGYERIPRNHQKMLCWAGLRGAIAFALSLDVDTPNGPVIRTTTLIIVVCSVLVFGGSTMAALERFDIKLGVVEHSDSEEDEDVRPLSKSSPCNRNRSGWRATCSRARRARTTAPRGPRRPPASPASAAA